MRRTGFTITYANKHFFIEALVHVDSIDDTGWEDMILETMRDMKKEADDKLLEIEIKKDEQ